jgi:hypothetical protein
MIKTLLTRLFFDDRHGRMLAREVVSSHTPVLGECSCEHLEQWGWGSDQRIKRGGLVVLAANGPVCLDCKREMVVCFSPKDRRKKNRRKKNPR